MSVTYGFYNSLNGDRKYDATQISSMFDGLIIDGIFASIGTCFVVNAATGNTVNVGIGKAWFNKTWTLNDAILPLEAPISEVLLDRIDAVVIEVDTSEAVRANSIKFVQGTPSSQPVRPTMASSETLHQYPLCYIYRASGSTEITQADITNMVGTEETPFITGILQTISLNELLGQWEDELDQFVASEQDDFTNWFNQMKEILNEDAVGNILDLINDNKEESDTKFGLIDSKLADYEYKTPIIDGTQIQLQKLSDTNILKFKLDADLSGGDITISTDEGATSKPLVDIDGVAVTELSRGFVEVVENGVNFTYAPKGKGASLTEANEIIFSAESIDYGGTIYSITSDDNYLYVGGDTTQRVYKLNKSDLSKVTESIDYGGTIRSITADDKYLYVVGNTTKKVYKLNKFIYLYKKLKLAIIGSV